MFYIKYLSSENRAVKRQCGKIQYSLTDHRRQYNTALAHLMLDKKGQRHILSICNNSCLYTKITFTRRHFNITLSYITCLLKPLALQFLHTLKSFSYSHCVSFSFKLAQCHEVIENHNFIFSSILSSTHISYVYSGQISLKPSHTFEQLQ